jgi:hypothetical protein
LPVYSPHWRSDFIPAFVYLSSPGIFAEFVLYGAVGCFIFLLLFAGTLYSLFQSGRAASDALLFVSALLFSGLSSMFCNGVYGDFC